MNHSWNVAGLILEGVCGTGKSTILKSIIQSERFIHRSPLSSVILSEHQTQRVLEQKEREKNLTRSDNISLLDQHVTYLEKVHDRLEKMQWCNNNRSNMQLPFVLERFHFTHVCHYSHISWSDVSEIDARLAKLNCRVCFFKADDSTLEDRIISNRDEGWRSYLSRIGSTTSEIIEHYSRQQKQMLALREKSALESQIIDTTDRPVDEVLQQVLDFWGAV